MRANNFNSFWTTYVSSKQCTLLEYLAYMSVFINECNGNLVSQSERYGSPAHPGIAYLYDHFKITTPNRTFWKASYNTRTYNRTAGSLFRGSSLFCVGGMHNRWVSWFGGLANR